MPKVSVIMPVYNNAEYLPQAVESVLGQRYRDLELLIVDDGSTDATAEIARRYETEQPERVVCLRRANGGPGAARNTGLRIAKGEYIAFLDADDKWTPDKLEKQAAVLDARPEVGFVYTDLAFIDKRNRVKGHGTLRKRRLPRGVITMALFNGYFMFTSSMMVRRECIRRAGLYREDINVGEDYDYQIRLSSVCAAEVLEEELLEKRIRRESLSNLDWLKNSMNDLLIYTDFLKGHPAFYQDNRAVLDGILGERSLSLAYWLQREGRKKESLRYLAMSLRYRPSLKAVKGIAQSALPLALIRLARRVVHGPEEKPKLETEEEGI